MGYPYTIPYLKNLTEFEFSKNVTFIIGENGSGKSTFIEGIAIRAGFNPEGGSSFLRHSTYDTHSQIFQDFKLVRGPYRNKDGYFIRAESFYNIATEIEKISTPDQLTKNYGGYIHRKSHGEGFLNVICNRLSGNGLYIFDEPEAALSTVSILKLMVVMKDLEDKNSQFIIATHSPILLAYPNAQIYSILENELVLTEYKNSEPYLLTKLFLNDSEAVLDKLFKRDS